MDQHLDRVRAFLSEGVLPDLLMTNHDSFIKSATRYFVRDDQLWRRRPDGTHQVIPAPHA